MLKRNSSERRKRIQVTISDLYEERNIIRVGMRDKIKGFIFLTFPPK
jgi:hypothetical protein